MRDYSLWLIPSDEQRSALKELMKYRPSSYRKNPRSYSLKSFPHFEPHITLASVFLPFQPSLDMLLPSSNPEQVTAKFESLRVGHTSLSVTLEKTRELMALHHAIDAHLKLNHIENSSGRSPHIPLFYLDEADSGDRQALKEELQEKGLVKNTGEGLLLNPVGAAELTADEIWLMDCTGEVAQWKWLERRDLVLWNRQKAMPGRRSFSLPIPRAPPIPPFKQNKSHGDEHTQFPSTKSTRWPVYPSPVRPRDGKNKSEVQESLRRLTSQTHLPPVVLQGPDLYDGIYLPAYMDSPDPTSVSVPPIGWNVSHTDGRAQSLPTESTSSTRHPFMAMPQVGEESPWLPSAEYSNEYPPMGYPVMAMPQAGEESPWLPSAEYSNEYPPEWGSPISDSFDPRRFPVPFAPRPVAPHPAPPDLAPMAHPSKHPAGTAKQNRDGPPTFCSTVSEEPETLAHLDSPDLTPVPTAHAPRAMPRRVRKVSSSETVSSSTSNNYGGASTTESLQISVQELSLNGGTGGDGGAATGAGSGTGFGGTGGVGEGARIVGSARNVYIIRTCSQDSYLG